MTHRRSRRVPPGSLAGLLVALACALVIGAGSVVAAGKPGYPTKVTWGGVSWQVKTSSAAVGPGPNIFAAANVNVDGSGYLHLRISQQAGKWTCAEVIAPTSHGYGTYTFVVNSSLAEFDRNAVLGLFTWSDKAPYAHREIDIEVAKWGNAADTTNAQFVVQPYNVTNHLVRLAEPGSVRTSQSFTWRAGSITWVAKRLDTNAVIQSYTYTGSDVPIPGDERVRLNLWLFNGSAPAAAAEVIVESFAFTP